MILIDSNVLIDIVGGDPRWSQWSMDQVATLSAIEVLAYNEIAVAEVAPSLGSIDAFNLEMSRIAVRLESFTENAAFCAGIAFRHYRNNRRKGGECNMSIIADFLVGGHAETLNASILTRDPRFYRTYFPTVPLICPTKDAE